MAAVAEHTADWAPDLMLTDVIVDRTSIPSRSPSRSPVKTRPPHPDLLAERLAASLGKAVDIDVVFVPLTTGSAAAP